LATAAQCLIAPARRALRGRAQLGANADCTDGDLTFRGDRVVIVERPGLVQKSGCDRFVAPPGDPLTRGLAILAHADRVEGLVTDGSASETQLAFDDVKARASTEQLKALLADANPATRAYGALIVIARAGDLDVIRPLLRDDAVVSDQMFAGAQSSVDTVIARALCKAASSSAAKDLLASAAADAFAGSPALNVSGGVVEAALACDVEDVRLDRLAVTAMSAADDGKFSWPSHARMQSALGRLTRTTAPDVRPDANAVLKRLCASSVDTAERIAAAHALAIADAPGAVDVVTPMLDDKDARVRDAGLRAIAVLSTTSDDEMRALFADRSKVSAAAIALAEKRDARSLRLLEGLLMHLDIEAGYLRDALHELEQHRDDDVDALVLKLESSSKPEIAHWAHAVRAGVKNASRVLH
jgi:hypothetical protein